MKPLIEKTLIFAHRGACAYAPENTMESFDLALQMGADGIELDVHLSADGEVVVCHDEKIDRTSNGQGYVSEYTLSELKNFDFGYHFYNGQRKGIKIPTLDEVYDLLSSHDMVVNVEIKSSDHKIIEACDEIASRHKFKEKIIYSSFNHFQIQKMKNFNPDAFIAPLYNFNMLNPWNYCLDINAEAVHPKYTQIRLMDNYVKNCHDRGIRVHSWTANTQDDIRFLLDVGTDAIITNHPDIAKLLRDEKRGEFNEKYI